jgi:hypothetical protein
MKRKPAAKSPQFDVAPIDDDEEEGACPIPDENGDVVLKGGRRPRARKRKQKRKTPSDRRK